jgi:hypothetical protein
MSDAMKTCLECGRTNDPVFILCECGAVLPAKTVSELVAAWFDGEHLMFDAIDDAPEVAWHAILEILKHELTKEQISLLAAGPLEDLLCIHGPRFIDRVEEEARQNERFNHLLGGVWQNSMTPEVWERVQQVRSTVW